MNKPIWKVQEYIEDVPFRTYRWKNYTIILQYPSDKINLSQYRVAVSKNNQKPKIVSVHTKYSDAIIYIKMYQHESEIEQRNKQSFFQKILITLKNLLKLQ